MTARAGGQQGQALILLAMWLFFGGGAASALIVYEYPVAQMKQAIERALAKDSRRDAILADIDQWEYVQEKQNEKVSEKREALLEALRRKETQRSQLDPILGELDKTFQVMDWDFLNLRFRVKAQVTRAEWTRIVAPASAP